jgi:hypothetical protein
MDLKLDSLTHDLVYTDGDLETVTGYAEALQRLKVALDTGYGEWAFDTEAGIAYRGVMRDKNAPRSAKEAEIRRVVYAVLGPGSIVSLQIDENRVTRELVGTVNTIYGPVEIG